MKRGDRITVTIGDVAFGGDGVGRQDERVLFVPFTVDGDEAAVEITEVKSRYARGRLVNTVAPSGFRKAAPCPYYARCGGCRMQHIAYDHQLALKRRQITEIFTRIARFSDPVVLPVIPSPLPFGYRQKAEFHVRRSREGLHIGFMALASNEIVDVESCAIVHESINRKYARLRADLRRNAARDAGDRLVIWADGYGGPPAEMPPGGRTGREIVRTLRGKEFTLSYDGFFQANAALVGELVDQVVGMCALTGRETVVDAYGGAGLFSLFLAPRAGRIFGIEGDREAARCAGLNLRREGVVSGEFFAGDVATVIRNRLVRSRVAVDVVVLDPPRDGCDGETLREVAALGARRIVYVSCNPATQARDCRGLAAFGYTLCRLQPLDMFPQTAHIEVVALLM